MMLLDRQIRRAQQRLVGNIFSHRLAFSLLIATGLWTALVLTVRLFAFYNIQVWLAGAAAAGLAILAGAVATMLARPTALQAAIALDGAAGLKERLSTALLVRGQSQDAFAQAAVHDAEKAAGSVHVPAHIRYRAPELLPWSAAAMFAALLLALFLPQMNLLAGSKQEPTVPRAQLQAQHTAIKTELEKKANKISEMATENPKLAKLAEDIGELKLPEQAAPTPDADQQQVVKKIEEVRERLERELADAEDSGLKDLQRMFRQMEQSGSVASNNQIAKSLADGNLEGAKSALQELAQDIKDAAKNAEDPAAQEKLKEMEKQLEAMSNELEKLCEDSTRIQRELEKKAGLSEEDAKKLMDELKKMDPKQLEKELQKRLGEKGMNQQQAQELAKKIAQNQAAKKQCQNMAKSMKKAAQGCKSCQNGKQGNKGQQSNQGGSQGSQGGEGDAAAGLSQAADQLSEMEMSEQMMNQLQSELNDLKDLQDSACKGNGNGSGQQGNKIGSQGPNAGLGYGEKVGKQATPYKPQATKAPTRYEGGTIIGRMLVEGPQVRGEASSEEVATAMSELNDVLDNVEREDVPRQYHPAMRSYFERLAGLVRDQGVGEPAEKAKSDAKPEGDGGAKAEGSE